MTKLGWSLWLESLQKYFDPCSTALKLNSDTPLSVVNDPLQFIFRTEEKVPEKLLLKFLKAQSAFQEAVLITVSYYNSLPDWLIL